MSGTSNQTSIIVIYEKMLKYGDGWTVYGNEPDFPHTVVANDLLKIVSQIYDANYELVGWMRHKWYHPCLTNEELKGKLRGSKSMRGLFKPTELKPSLSAQRKWYKDYVEARNIKKSDD